VIAHRDPGPQLEQELKDFALQHMEPYKHPRSIIFVETLPRTHLGKVDRAALRNYQEGTPI
jgi:acyl-coenzyme A synthetase/AMP-(fatty) acid ligase